MEPAIALEAAAKAAVYAALLAAVGACAMHWLLLPRVAGDVDPDVAGGLERAIAGLTLTAAAIVCAATLLRVWTHSVSAFGLDESASAESLRTIALQSRWGAQWRWQGAAAVALLIAAAANRARRTGAWPIASLAVLAFCVTVPLVGHASGDPLHVTLHTIHLLGAGVWVGTLAAVLIVARDAPIRLTLLRRFAPIAMSGAAMLAGAGLVMSWWYLGVFSNLWTTGYGGMLALKVALVGCVAACGGVNWQTLRGAAAPDDRWRPIVAMEVALAVAVVLVTSVLTETAHP